MTQLLLYTGANVSPFFESDYTTVLLRPPLPGFAKENLNPLSPGYQDLMGHLILNVSP